LYLKEVNIYINYYEKISQIIVNYINFINYYEKLSQNMKKYHITNMAKIDKYIS
jgi:hypothetical protein